MEDAQSSLAPAIQMEDDGHIKEAYMAYLATAQQSLEALYDIKFVHSAIIGKPKHYSTLISTMRLCMDHVESVIERHSPAPPRTINQTRHPPIVAQTTGDSKAPPPLPPKPSRMQKPVLPPKPARAIPPRPPPSIINKDQPPTPPTHPLPPTPPTPPPPVARSRVFRPVDEARPLSLPSQSEHRRPPHRPLTEFPDTVAPECVAEGEIDPTHLVPAQTNAGDSLTPNSHQPTSSDHIPLIPAPPLLTTHRALQVELDELEQTLKEYRSRKQNAAHRTSLETMTEDDLNQLILQASRRLADVKQTLNRVRTLYMSAATIPTVMQFQAHIIAYQITLIESAIYISIPPHALLEHTAKRPHPRIVASTDFFNYVTRFIEHSILLSQDASARAQQVHYWIKVASRCLDLNNYQTLKAIVSALGTPPVQRLRRTWAYIPKKSLVKLESLSELMSEASNYGRYREHMGMVSVSVVNGKSVALIRAEHTTRPTVPFLGTFIHDITYLLAAFKTHSQGGLPEDEPRIHEVLMIMAQFQSGPRYPSVPPASYLKLSQKHYFRPALSNALHRGASGISRISGAGLFGFGQPSASSPVERDDDDDNGPLEEQQQMATQYILMRSWVAQSTVDELSALREPPHQKASSIPGSRSSNGNGQSSVLSTASSAMRFSTDSVSLGALSSSGNGSRPTSAEDS
ncbi:ras guanine nucleotide exchange factor domain-containing protein [Phycomyces nitens]|nr:ras guanine nucleotide exchange factor domain-containing protein [Phycomyces nitens]